MSKKKYLLIAATLACLIISVSFTLVGAAGQVKAPVDLAAGDSVVVNCKGGKVQVAGNNSGAATIKCLGAPLIEGVIGLGEGAAIKGTVNLEAKVTASASPISVVIFDLYQGTVKVNTQNDATAPYFYYGDNQGTPNGWDTTKLADGNYSLVVTANAKDGQSSNLRVNFSIRNSVVPTTTAAATPTPTSTPHGGMDMGVCGEDMNSWHPPVVTGPDGKPCNTGHEHGDAPPAWIAAAGYTASFHGHFNTSPLENTTKHAAMKGFSTRFGDVDVYFRIHAASNPLDRMARYHSYEVFARDPSGAVSHWQLWYNTGDPLVDRYPRRTGSEPSVRPLMLVVDATSQAQGINCEQWYSGPGEPQWGWDFGWTICGATVLFTPGESAIANDQSKWPLTGSLGGTRRLEAAWYSGRTHPTGAFWSTQFGDIVSGPNDAKCTGSTVKFGVTYQNVCLDQYIAPTMKQVAFPGNAVQKDFNTTGVKIPN